MQKLKIDQDIRSMSEVRNAMASYIKQVHNTKRQVIITQQGKGVAVLLGAKELEATLCARKNRPSFRHSNLSQPTG
jgi:prevent-host-death family protein